MKLPLYIYNPETDCVVTFGVQGWSSYFFADLPLEYDIKKLYRAADRLMPNDIRTTHPANEKLKFIKVFRFQGKVEFDEKGCVIQEETQEAPAEGI